MLVDGGVRRGTDVVTALALGADAVLVARPVAWGLAVAGEAGAADVLRILAEATANVMAQCGCRTVAEITPDLVTPAPGDDPARLLGPFAPMTRIDLHTHSTCSDGTNTIAENVALALERGLDGIAITDHDTTEGFAGADAAAAGPTCGSCTGSSSRPNTTAPRSTCSPTAWTRRTRRSARSCGASPTPASAGES